MSGAGVGWEGTIAFHGVFIFVKMYSILTVLC